MGGNLLKLRAWWETADRTTKTVTLVGSGLLVALLMGVFYLSSSPDMKQLFPALEPTEQGRVIQKLQELKVPYKQEPDGSIHVPAHQIAETRARLAAAGMPASGALGVARLDGGIGMADPEPLMDEKLRVTLEEELKKTIELMAPVAAAKVHIAPGDSSPFVNTSSDPSASVVVRLQPTGGSPREVAGAIVRVMLGGVQGLKQKDVYVSDSNGVVLWDGESDDEGGAVAGKKRDAELAEAGRLEKSIERMIVQAVGPGKAVVSANVEMSFDKEEVVTNEDKPTKQPISSETLSETYGQGARIGVGGAATNNPAPAEAGSGGAGSGYSRAHTVTNNGNVSQRTVRSVAPGRMTAARVSIMLDDSVAAQADQIKQFAGNLIGSQKDPANFSVAVATSAFDKTAAEAAKKDLAAAKSGQTMQQVFSLLPLVVLLFVGFMVIKALGKTAANNRNVMLTSGALAAPAMTRHAAASYQGAPSAPLMVATAPAGTSDLSDAAKKRADAIKQSIRPDVDDIPEKFDANLEQILRMADTRPESVALLVKSWLLEETN